MAEGDPLGPPVNAQLASRGVRTHGHLHHGERLQRQVSRQQVTDNTDRPAKHPLPFAMLTNLSFEWNLY